MNIPVSEHPARHIVWHDALISKTQREQLNGHKGCVLWFTGLSGAGKSTVANAVDERLFTRGLHSFVLDGDNLRHGLCADLGFAQADRTENIRRVGEVAKLFADAGLIVATAFISPYQQDRLRVRERLGTDAFFEIFCRCPLDVCESRDTKGLYRRARAGQIPEFTGISGPYEEPLIPDLILDTHECSVAECVEKVIQLLFDRRVIA